MSSIMRVFKILPLVLCFSASAFASNSFYIGGGIASSNSKLERNGVVTAGSYSQAGSANGSSNAFGAFVDAGYKISLKKFYISPEAFFQLQSNAEVSNGTGKVFAANGPLYGGLVRFGYDFQNNLRVNIFGGVTNAERYSALLGDYNPIFQTTTRAFYGTYGLGLAYKINDKFDVKGDISYVDLGSNGANGLSYSSTTVNISDKFSMMQVKVGVTRYL
jgi:hypothetical protein